MRTEFESTFDVRFVLARHYAGSVNLEICNIGVPNYNILRTARRIYTCKKKNLHGLSPRANYTDRATAACRRSDCQLLRIEGAMWSA
jgi:hypothetical protein